MASKRRVLLCYACVYSLITNDSVVNFSPTLSAVLQGASDVSVLGNLTQVCVCVMFATLRCNTR